jgi:hypothetical protein
MTAQSERNFRTAFKAIAALIAILFASLTLKWSVFPSGQEALLLCKDEVRKIHKEQGGATC